MSYTHKDSVSAAGCMIAELPPRERPRERLIQCGTEALSDTELLAILLGSGTRGTSVLHLSRQVLTAFGGNLEALASASVRELRRVRGIGEAKATQLHAAFALARRLTDHSPGRLPRLESPADVYRFFQPRFRGVKQEEFHALLLDTKHHLLCDEKVTIGLVDRTQIHAREVFRTAIRESCSRMILVHNHPSGDPTPSTHDINSTKNLVSAGRIVGIEVLDHVIVGSPSGTNGRPYLSFREENLLA